jgi:hypothetical protein
VNEEAIEMLILVAYASKHGAARGIRDWAEIKDWADGIARDLSAA